jgi:hypothetical protein
VGSLAQYVWRQRYAAAGERLVADQRKLCEAINLCGDLIAGIKNGAQRRRLEAVCSVGSY